MRSIAVDSPHRMYLYGRSMIPTHDTPGDAQGAAEPDSIAPDTRVDSSAKRFISGS